MASNKRVMETIKHSVSALQPSLMKHACCFAYLKSPKLTTWDFCSGTLIQIGDRFFVCTASHCIERGGDLEKYHILDSKTRSVDERSMVIAQYRTPNDNPDVGLLELDPSRIDALSKTPVTLDRIELHGPGKSNHLLLVVGIPAEIIRRSKDGQDVIAGLTVFASLPIEADDPHWSRDDLQQMPNKEVDILLEFPDEAFHNERFKTIRKGAVPKPFGMSGGGIWDLGYHRSKALWTPSNPCLIGLDVAWLQPSRLLVGVQIIHWLKLVHENYPDLRGTLEAKFPELKAG